MGKYFTIGELTKSSTAKQLGIKNIPGEEEKRNLEELISLLDVIRETYGSPIRVNSGFRCEKLNKVVGGSKTSQHRFGQAADIVPFDRDVKGLFNHILSLINTEKIVVGQLIDEYDYSWVHISLPTERLHNQILHIKKK